MPSPKPNETLEQREKRLARQRKYELKRKELDPEGFKQSQLIAARKYRENNKEKTKAATKKWRENNRDKFNSARRNWRSKNLVRCLFLEARSRAKRKGVEFSIEIDDIPEIGEFCPIFGDKFPPHDVRKTPFSPSIDRIDPKKGYIKGNVWIIGYRANLVKNDGTANEHQKIADAMNKMLKEK
jgi:hypothetical protein